jgi:hypothetical protein
MHVILGEVLIRFFLNDSGLGLGGVRVFSVSVNANGCGECIGADSVDTGEVNATVLDLGSGMLGLGV